MSDGRGPTAAIGRRLRDGLVNLAWFAIFHPRTVLILMGVVSAFAFWGALNLTLSTNAENLLPANVQSAQVIRGLLQRYGSAEPVIIAIAGQGEADLDDRTDLALGIRERLESNALVRPVTGLFGEDPWSLLDSPVANALLLYLAPDEVDAVARELSPEAIDRRVAANLERLRSPLGPLTARLVAEDPLGFAGFALRNLGALKGRLTLGAREGVLVTEDAKYVLVLVRPNGPSGDVDFARKVLQEIETVARDAMVANGVAGTVGVGPAPAGDGGEPAPARGEGQPAPEGDAGRPLYVGLTGSPAILLDYRDMLARDAGKISIVSYVAQLILFVIAFRRAGAVLIAGTSVLIGGVWALGFAYVTIGEINVFTVGSIGILFGLTIDFSVHIYNRYLEEVHNGKDMLKAFGAAHGETGLGILASVGVMVWAFVAAGMSRFRGMRDLGIICSSGLVLSLFACLLLIPALTALSARVKRSRDTPRGLADFGLLPLTVVLAVVLTLACAVPAVGTRLDDDFAKMRPKTAPSVVLQDDLVAHSGASLQPVLALVPGDSDAEILERSARLEAALLPLAQAEDGPLSAVLGPSRVVPPPARQAAALERLRALRASGAIEPAAVEARLLAALEANGFRVDERAHNAAARVRRLLSRDAPLTLDEARQGPLGMVLDDLVVRTPDGRRLGIVSAYPRPGALTTKIVPALQRAIAASGVPAQLAGARVLSQEIRPLILRDAVTATIVSAAGIMLILLLAFRRLALVLLTTLPLVCGLLASVGLMALFRVEFNLVTISMLPLIIGIAIDNGIHVVHRYVQAGDEDVADVLRHTGRGVVMVSLTTIVGFGALLFADYPGLVSSGVLAMLGTGVAMLASVTVLPALLLLVDRGRARKP
jgi:predicted RND superfamily exporter protein